MSGDTLYEAPKRCNVSQMRVHDYLYDSAFIVSGARDYARTAFKAAMASAQMVIQPMYKTMFSELRQFPRMQVVYHPNCRLPHHVDRSYGAYLNKVQQVRNVATPQLGGKDRFKFCAAPKRLLPIKSTSPDFQPPTAFLTTGPTKPRNRGTQSLYRESSAQTIPWQPDARPAEKCETTPEVLYLDKLEWGPGSPYRVGDLPADFHTTEIINKMRHARKWSELVEKGNYPGWMKKRDAIITDIETKDWIFREAEIDELQSIRQVLLQKIQTEQTQKTNTRTSTKLANLWMNKKTDMEKRIETIHRTRDRELRKLSAIHNRGGGLVEEARAARGGGSITRSALDPTSDTHAPRSRHGYQARRRHAEISYDASLLILEDHAHLADPPPWLQQCGQNLSKTCSGKHLPRDKMQLCERETKWSEQFLKNLHDDLKKARLGAATSAGPLRVLKPRNVPVTPRPSTPEVEEVPDDEEASHQSALMIQRLLKGRAVQNLMFEGRTRSAELTEELKTTHGLQKEDRVRIQKEAAKARDYIAVKSESEQKEQAISALVDELCGGAVSSALDFLEKELRRLKEERRQHAYILIAIREKTMREAAEAGRRQKEEHRRREHDEMFKQVLGVTQSTVDAYLSDITRQGSELTAELQAVQNAKEKADAIDAVNERGMSTAEQHELVADLVHHFLIPSSHREASRVRIRQLQESGLVAAREEIFGVIDDGVVDEEKCKECGNTTGKCKCRVCPVRITPTATSSRDDPRWKYARRHEQVEKTLEERYPPSHEMRNMLNSIVDDAVEISRYLRKEGEVITRDISRDLRERTEILIDAEEVIDELISRATGEIHSIKRPQYRHYMRRIYVDALERTDFVYKQPSVPQLLPSELRTLQEEEDAKKDPYCHCEKKDSEIVFELDTMTSTDKMNLLPSELRILEDFRRCKCDTVPSPSPVRFESPLEEMGEKETEEDDVTDEEFGE